MRTISHTYRILPMVIFALFSFSSKVMKADTSNLNISHFAKKKKIIKTRKETLAKSNVTAHKVLFQSLVAHGKNSGEEFASSFSNKSDSYKSSLGFYSTGEIYKGKHGLSLKLDGLERGINDNARPRGVVVHASQYVSDSFLRNHRKLGRSQGCPALPEELASKIIGIIKNKSCLFIYHPSISETTLNEII